MPRAAGHLRAVRLVREKCPLPRRAASSPARASALRLEAAGDSSPPSLTSLASRSRRPRRSNPGAAGPPRPPARLARLGKAGDRVPPLPPGRRLSKPQPLAVLPGLLGAQPVLFLRRWRAGVSPRWAGPPKTSRPTICVPSCTLRGISPRPSQQVGAGRAH